MDCYLVEILGFDRVESLGSGMVEVGVGVGILLAVRKDSEALPVGFLRRRIGEGEDRNFSFDSLYI